MMRTIVALSLCFGTAFSHGLSDSGCQCTAACSAGSGVGGIFGNLVGNPECTVDQQFCPGKTKDDCPNGLQLVVSAISDFFTGTFSQDKITKLGGWTAASFAKIEPSQLAGHFSELQDSLGKFTSDQLKDVDPADITADGWASLKTNLGATAKWSKNQLQKIPVKEIGEATAQQLKKIPTEEITQFTVDQLQAINYDKIGAVLKGGWDMVPVENVAQLSWEQLQQIPYDEIGSALDTNWDKVPLDTLMKLTGEQIDKIPAVELTGLQTYWNMVPVGHVAKFGAQTLEAIGIENIDPEKIGQVTNDVWDKVPVGQISKLSAEALQKIDYDGLAKFTQEQWNSVPFEKAISLTGEKVRAIPAADVHTWTEEQWASVPVDKAIMFTGEQMNNAGVLGKLSIDALSEYAKTGQLDTTLLNAETKKQLDDIIELAGGKAAFEAMGTEAILAIKAVDAAQIIQKAKVLERDELNMTPGATQEQKTAADQAVVVAQAAVQTSVAAARTLGYTTLKRGTGGTASMVLPAIALLVLPVLALA